ncbi:SWIM zinc finger family protein [Pyxidicoccus fallax]|uniref:SWIM zinc finger family protein n=1 Tax=Pyxidicoccus fallax TaxID=394095 RepID=A0A848L509_9BACT|nr:SWIM zinc finger family protein [Pyxidicoccus fallax]NMO13794.1 SWIM zinc finger family protein [Pyxidicoccus fallax]NPC77019.1 SWIM zinc finger family protein [Pyxidicoccus fallax]
MNLDLKYLGRSGVVDVPGGSALSFQPNLARPQVFFDQELKHPLRFREAISALHEVVVGDLRIKKKDKSAYEAWKAEEARQEDELRRAVLDQEKKAELAKLSREPIPPNLKADFQKMHRLYWDARVRWANELSRNDPELFRALVPCDPVVTVAPDVVFFECFAKDESSYGCLFVDRDAFSGKAEAATGTTNVDYSLALYEHFQTLRTYRPTRLQVDPTGFEVKVQGHASYREEKIDLPPTWLRGFGQLQAAMGLPARRVELSVDAVYSLLTYLKRHREKTGPRSLRFQLRPGAPASVVLEPWGVTVQSRGKAYDGPAQEDIKVWGRRRLMVLARLLPLAERVEVQLLGSGLPSIWTVHMGEMRMVLALSGWTANDWTGGASLELLAGDARPDARAVELLTQRLREVQRATLAELASHVSAPREALLGSLHLLAKQGQVVYDFAAQSYRWRQVMPVALSESVLGPEPEEVVQGRRLYQEQKVKLLREESLSGARRVIVAKVAEMECEALFDLDGGLSRAKCGCAHFRRVGLRAGPCRHLLALRLNVLRGASGFDMGLPGPAGRVFQ